MCEKLKWKIGCPACALIKFAGNEYVATQDLK